MKNTDTHKFRTTVSYVGIALIAASSLVYAQDSTAPPAPPPDQQQPVNPSGGWRRVGDPPPSQDPPAAPSYPNYASNQDPPNQGNGYPAYQSADPNQAPPAPPTQPNYGNPPSDGNQPAYGNQPNYSNQPNYGNQPNYQAPPAQVPAQLTIPAGTFMTVRINQVLSSDKNQVGDGFSATLVQPLVVNGIVIAEPGQTIGGRVAMAQRHGMGVPARLGVQLTTLTLVDGQQIPINSQLVSRKGGTTPGGAEAGTIVATTGIGAAIGAAADWGTGAAIGAGAGALAGLIGVVVTHNHASVIYPEQILTFRLETPVTISTANSAQAFRYVQPNEYDRPYYAQSGPGPYATAPPPPGPYYYGYPYPYAYGGYSYWGPGFSFYWGPAFYGRGWYGGYRGWYGGRYYAGHGYVSTGRGSVTGGFRGGVSGGSRR